MKQLLPTLGLVLTLTSTAIADFAPIVLNQSSFNQDVVVESTAPRSLNDAVNATMDGGTNKSGNTWFEVGYYPGHTNGVPAQNSLISNSTADHTWRMAPDYHVNNVIMVGHNGGGQTPLAAPGTLTLTTPATFTALSLLTSSGNGPVLVGYRIHYADTTTEEGTFNSINWFDPPTAVFNAAGRLSVSGGGLQNIDANPACRAFQADIPLGNSSVNVTSIDFYYAGSGANGNTNNNGRAVIFAVSGSTDNVTYSPVAVTGYNYDVVVEADGPKTTGTGLAAASTLTNNITVSMDGGTSKSGSVWYEKGYYAAFPNTGIPAAGSSVTSAWYSARYVMPSSYVGNCAVFLAQNVSNANISFSAPASYGALSFLCATANGDTTVPCILNFQDGSSETNAVFIPDWFNRALPWSYLSFGRVAAIGNFVNNSFDQFVDPFATPYPFSFDFRGLALPPGRLFDAVINVTNTASAITNIALNFTNGAASTRTISIFAVSGAPVGAVPPVFGANGSPTPGQPANAAVNGVNLVKRWEGTNNIVLSVTNIAGTSIAYQWMKAPRGGGLRDKMYSWDYSGFVNVANGGRVSGATSSALVISNALSADSADYLVVASNPYGSITSQVATVMILTTNQSLLVGAPAGDIIANYTGDGSPAAESIDHASDRVAQKWLSFGFTAGQALPFQGPSGYTITPVSGASIATAMRFYTANDSQGRDPLDYALEGSNDGATWTALTGGRLIGTLWLPTGRNGTGVTPVDPLNQNVVEVNFANATGYKSYRVTITNTIDRLRQGLMQIAEIEILGSLVPNPPVWVRQPDPSATVFVGASPSFTVSASGYPPAKYQWYKNGATLIPGATSSTYTFTNAQLSDSGTTFHCVASNNFAQVPSTSLTLTVIPAPTQPYPVAALADNPIGYWRLNEGPDNGSGNNGVIAHDYRGGHNGYFSNVVLVLPGYNPVADPDTAGQFGSPITTDSLVANINDVDFARATNAGGGTFSVEAWALGGNQSVDGAIVTKGYNGALNVGTGTGTEQFVIDVTGASPKSFRFLVRDAAGNGHVAQSTALPYDSVNLQPTWRHLVGVCDQPNGKVYLYVDGKLAASGDIGATAGILAQPLPMTIGARKSGGNTGYDNQWSGNIDDVAVYGFVLTPSQILNHFLAAQRPPVISLQPTNQTTPENVLVTFSSGAYGPGALTYQWYLSDGSNPTTPVGGQTSSNLTFTTLASQNGNYYQLVVTNPYGSTTGAVAQLTVVSGPPSFFVDLPSSETFFLGHVIQLRVSVGGTAPFTYQWQKNGVNLTDNYRISGSQTNVLTIAYASYGDSGNYQVLVSNGTTSPSTLDAVTVTNSSVALNAAGTGWTQNGSPIMTANRLELTSGLGNTARSAFLTDKQGIGSFLASFIYQTVSGAGGADGATFCIQNASPTALGGGGGALGYGTITPSVALAFNIYDPNTRGIRLFQNGTVTTPFAPITPVLVGGNANPIQVNLSYSGGVLTAAFLDTVSSATFTTNFVVDIPGIVGGNTAYVGFTGADGGVASTQVISNFTMAPPPVKLNSQVVGNNLVLSWPASIGAFLKSTPSLSGPVWTDVTAPFKLVGSQAQVTVPLLPGNQFYRLEVYP
ncbi:MAG: immunoglobulin domain-containing protein [Verrucomicrobiota bacterium]